MDDIQPLRVQFEGRTYIVGLRRRQFLTSAMCAALAAMVAGVGKGFRWLDPARDFTVEDETGAQVPMDAFTLTQFGCAVVRAQMT